MTRSLRDQDQRRRGIDVLAWFAGVRRDALKLSPGEAPFYNGLGAAVLATALVSGVTLATALGFTLHETAMRLWPVGVAWALIVLNLDRLLLMLSATRRVALVLIPRFIISFVVGALIAEVATLWIYAPEINAQMQLDVQHEIQFSTGNVSTFYGTQIRNDQKTETSIQSSENSLITQINEDKFLSQCESTDAYCSTTHLLGCGAYCLHYRQITTSLQQELHVVKPEDDARVRQLQSEIAELNMSQAKGIRALSSAATGSTGLIAREDALTQIERAHPGITVQVWFIRGALVLLDLMPLIIKSLYLAFGDSSYEAVASSYKRRERVAALEIELQARVERGRLNEQALADEALNRFRIQGQRDAQIAEEEEKWYGPSSSQPRRASEPGSPTEGNGIVTPDFTDFVAAMRSKGPHESLPVEVPRSLTVAGWTALGLTGISTWLLADVIHSSVAGAIVAALAFVSIVSLAVFTKGFRSAPAWAMRATFAALLVGLSLPVIVTILNL